MSDNRHVVLSMPLTSPSQVRNIDERVKIPELIESLRETFEAFGDIVDIVAKKNIRARGQAFVVYDSIESAEEAIEALNDFDLFGKPMQLAFAKTRSDATVLREDGEDGLEHHKKRRLAEKGTPWQISSADLSCTDALAERKQASEAAAQQQKAAKRAATETLTERPAKTAKGATAGVIPDEYLPPNKILFLRELPEDYDKDNIATIFRRFAGFKEVRMVPSRKGIAFVEYEDENAAISAKEATTGLTLGDKTVKVTFQRQ